MKLLFEIVRDSSLNIAKIWWYLRMRYVNAFVVIAETYNFEADTVLADIFGADTKSVQIK